MWLYRQWFWQWPRNFDPLARQGAKVFGTDINEEAGQNTSNFIKEEGNDFTFNQVNMTNERKYKSFLKKLKKNKKVDILVNVVGQSDQEDQ